MFYNINLDNYKEILPEKKWSMYLQYVNAPTWTGTNGEMKYDSENEILHPLSDDEAAALGVSFYTCQPWDLNVVEQEEDFFFLT